jgi:hypothetical protein
VGTLNNRLYIAVKPSPSVPSTEQNLPEVTTSPTSNWAIAAAVIIASVPHLWKFLSGAQSAQTNLTTTLLANLTEAHKQYSVSNAAFRTMVESVAKRPTEIAEDNALALRDLLEESAQTRGEVMKLTKKIEGLGTAITRLAQDKH